MKDLGDIRGGIITFPSGFVIDAVCKNVFYCNCCVTRYAYWWWVFVKLVEKM